jgi:hypothetical protein
MSKEFIEAEMKLFLEQCREVDIVISTVRSAFSIQYKYNERLVPHVPSHLGADPWFTRTKTH